MSFTFYKRIFFTPLQGQTFISKYCKNYIWYEFVFPFFLFSVFVFNFIFISLPFFYCTQFNYFFSWWLWLNVRRNKSFSTPPQYFVSNLTLQIKILSDFLEKITVIAIKFRFMIIWIVIYSQQLKKFAICDIS